MVTRGSESTVIYFVRHGLVYDPRLIVYGRLPRFRLDPEGVRQAHAAGLALRDAPIAHIFASPLLRARQTAARIAAFHPGVHVHISRLLLEVNTPFEGLPRAHAEARRWDMYTGATAAYEQPAQVLDRALKFVSIIRRRYAGQQVVAVTHGDVIAFLALWANGQVPDPRAKERYFPAPASISTLTFEPNSPLPAYKYCIPYQNP